MAVLKTTDILGPDCWLYVFCALSSRLLRHMHSSKQKIFRQLFLLE